MAYWASQNFSVTKGDAITWSHTFTDDDGNPVDVSAWVSYYKAASPWHSDTVELTSAAGDITYSDSGTGTTDTVNFGYATTDTDVTTGRYAHHFRATISGSPVTKFTGWLTVHDEEAGP